MPRRTNFDGLSEDDWRAVKAWLSLPEDLGEARCPWGLNEGDCSDSRDWSAVAPGCAQIFPVRYRKGPHGLVYCPCDYHDVGYVRAKVLNVVKWGEEKGWG